VTGYLLDTNVISETAKARRDPKVIAFLADLDEVYVSTIAVHELSYGLERLAPGRRRNALRRSVERFLSLYQDRLLPVGEAETRAAAVLCAAASGRGQTLQLANALVAASAMVNGLTVATRNVADFDGLGVPQRNPWQG
jgi:predicted nucleic acid-binding protein